MFETLVWATLAVCLGGAVFAYFSTKDVFHPAILLGALCSFMYVYMPLSLAKDRLLFAYVTEAQAELCQTLALLGIFALMVGCFVGAANRGNKIPSQQFTYSWRVLNKGAYILGLIGLGCWLATIRGAGGFAAAFGQADGSGWSDLAYIRDGIYLLVVALILLLTPDSIRNRNIVWYTAVVMFTLPWLAQGLLGARRGPTFVIACTISMSLFLSKRKRPALPVLLIGAGLLGSLMLFLVTNRDKIYIGSDMSNVSTDITSVVTDANESNEYIFGIGCIVNAQQTSHYFWGRRYLAQILVRPIPHQIWPNKYADVGLAELTQNAGVAGEGLAAVMGWQAVPGSAAAMIADLWVEFSWLLVPVLLGIGVAYGYTWKRAVDEGGMWNSQYTILAVLAVYMVTQSGEAVIFRLLILSVPTRWVWQKSREALAPISRAEVQFVS